MIIMDVLYTVLIIMDAYCTIMGILYTVLIILNIYCTDYYRYVMYCIVWVYTVQIIMDV